MFYLVAISFSFFLSPVKHAEYLGLNEINKPGENEFPLRWRVRECRLMLFTQTIPTGTLNKPSLIAALWTTNVAPVRLLT